MRRRGSALRVSTPEAAELELPARRDSAEIVKSADYKELLSSLKQRIRDAQFRAAQAVNSELVLLYWAIGRDILTRQEKANWGDKVIDYVAADLSTEFAEQKRGYSRRNLFYMRRFAALWPEPEIVQTLSAQIGPPGRRDHELRGHDRAGTERPGARCDQGSVRL